MNAEALARKYHKDQTDKQGNDYLEHHLRPVAESLPEHLRLAGWLHDTLEDTDATEESLRADGVDEETIRLVKALTNIPGETNEEATKRVTDAGKDATRVKIADSTNNLSKALTLPDSDPNKARWVRKYTAKLAKLHEALGEEK